MKKLTQTDLKNQKQFVITSVNQIASYILENHYDELDQYKINFLTSMLGFETTQGKQSNVMKEICIRLNIDISDFIKYYDTQIKTKRNLAEKFRALSQSLDNTND